MKQGALVHIWALSKVSRCAQLKSWAIILILQRFVLLKALFGSAFKLFEIGLHITQLGHANETWFEIRWSDCNALLNNRKEEFPSANMHLVKSCIAARMNVWARTGISLEIFLSDATTSLHVSAAHPHHFPFSTHFYSFSKALLSFANDSSALNGCWCMLSLIFVLIKRRSLFRWRLVIVEDFGKFVQRSPSKLINQLGTQLVKMMLRPIDSRPTLIHQCDRPLTPLRHWFCFSISNFRRSTGRLAKKCINISWNIFLRWIIALLRCKWASAAKPLSVITKSSENRCIKDQAE